MLNDLIDNLEQILALLLLLLSYHWWKYAVITLCIYEPNQSFSTKLYQNVPKYKWFFPWLSDEIYTFLSKIFLRFFSDSPLKFAIFFCDRVTKWFFFSLFMRLFVEIKLATFFRDQSTEFAFLFIIICQNSCLFLAIDWTSLTKFLIFKAIFRRNSRYILF